MEKIKIILGYTDSLRDRIRSLRYALCDVGIATAYHGSNVIETNHCRIYLVRLEITRFGYRVIPPHRGYIGDISFGLSPEEECGFNRNHKPTPEGINVIEFIETIEKRILEEMFHWATNDEIIPIAIDMIKTNTSFENNFCVLPPRCGKAINYVKQYEDQMKRVSKLAMDIDAVCSITMPEHKIRLVEPIEKVTFNGSATIVFWKDGDKTVVKCADGDKYDREKGLAMAICKKVLGDDYRNVFKEHIPEDDDDVYESPYGSLLDAFARFAFDSKGRGI